MLPNNGNSSNELTILSVVCKGVELSTSSPLLNSGFLSRVTGGSIPRNVKKLIRVQKSEPFPPGGRPASMLYDTIYESEPFEDVAILSPSLLVEIRNPFDKDCKIRINVYYSSSLTNGKEILLVATTFCWKEVVRCKQPIFTSQMVSEHCSQAIAFIRPLVPLPPVLRNKSIQSTSPIESRWNPMFQRYIFHSDLEKNQPVVCEEYTWEPRLTINVSYKYLLNLSNILTETLTAWKVRSELERIRQGKFISREEAFLNGWYELTISPSSCLINALPVSPSLNSIDEESYSSSPSVSLSSEDRNTYLNRIRLGSDDSLTLPDTTSSHSQRPSSTASVRLKKPINPALKQPSCYVEILIEHSDLLFALPVGRTNTEYFTLAPCFGSNANLRTGLRNASEFQLSPLADPDNVQITRIPYEHVVEDLLAGPDSRIVKYGSKNCFHVFVPFSSGGRIRCDLFAEDVSNNSGKGTLIGTYYHDIVNMTVKDESRPTNLLDFKALFSIKNAGAHPNWQILDAELSMGVSLQQQSFLREKSESLPPVSPQMNRFCYRDYNEKSLGMSSLSKSLGLFGENEIVQELDAILVDKISLERFSDSDDEDDDDDDDDDEFSSPTLKTSGKKQTTIIPSTFQTSLELSPSSSSTTSSSSVAATTTATATQASTLSPLASSAIMTSSVRANSGESNLSSRLRSFSAANSIPRDLRKASLYSAEIIGECYEWMWHVGFKGIDPLVLPSNDNTKRSQSNNGCEYLPRIDLPYSLIWINEHIKRLEYILCQIKYLIATYYEEITLHKSFRASKLKKEIEYQALPINLHIQNMVVQKCSSENPLLSGGGGAGGGGVATNGSGNGGSKKSEDTSVYVIDSITCGAMACHGLGYNQGGLHNIETTLQRSKANLENMKKQYANDINIHKLSGPPLPSSSSTSTSSSSSSTLPSSPLSSSPSTSAASSSASSSSQEQSFHFKSREYEFREFLSSTIFNYENSTTSIILRRIYSLSQIISIAVNSFIYKLELVVEGLIPSYFFERWYSFGYLILFECLLSVNGKERAMLEDTRTAIDMIQLYHFRIIPSPTSTINQSNSSHQWYRDHYQLIVNEKKKLNWLDGINTECCDVHVIGREILLFIPERSIDSLPEAIKSIIMTTGAVFNIKAALFSQGIDIMQSMTNAWDSHESGLSSRDLQYQINLQGLQQLNAYCELVQPVQTLSNSSSLSASTSTSTSVSTYSSLSISNSDRLIESLPTTSPTLSPNNSSSHSRPSNSTSGHLYSGLTQEAHPLIDILSNIIYTTNINEKNVEMLIEVERIGRILGACRVTFCKSGKDRTGMAITLEQSRLLGENFDCGQSFERIIRDANMMRQYGTRLMVAEKNIGRAIYAINRLQIKFLPPFYRPPIQLTEDIMKKSDNS